MKISRQQVIAAGLGAVAAAAIVVVVYEGGVRVVNAHGSVDLAPGETGRATPGGAPNRDPAHDPASGSGALTGLARLGADASRAELLADSSAVREQLAIAATKIERLEKQLAEVRDGPTKKIDPTKEQLLEWAKHCEVHVDAPDVFGATAARIDAQAATEWGLTKAEVPVLEHALSDLHDTARNEMREIYLAATGNTAVADEVTAGAMLSEIFDKALPGDQLRTRERLSRERAGLQAPPANLNALPPYERAMRLLLRLGNDFERTVGDTLTPARAHELRKVHDAWPGLQTSNEGCEERSR